MKKYRYLLIGLTAAVILLNVFLNLSIYRNQITYLRSFLSGQAIAGSDVIENILMKFENEVNVNHNSLKQSKVFKNKFIEPKQLIYFEDIK